MTYVFHAGVPKSIDIDGYAPINTAAARHRRAQQALFTTFAERLDTARRVGRKCGRVFRGRRRVPRSTAAAPGTGRGSGSTGPPA